MQGATGAPSAGDDAWREAGRALLAAFDHVWVLNMATDTARAAHMRDAFRRLGVPPARFSLFHGVALRQWGNWRGVPILDGAAKSHPDWWLTRPLCSDNGFGLGSDSPPPCLQSKYQRCVQAPPNGSLPRICGELCATLSAAAAVDEFRRSGKQTALFLEDDVCATPALLQPAAWQRLRWMGRRRSRWDLVKLGDCHRGYGPGGAGPVPRRRRRGGAPAAEALTSGTCAAGEGALPAASTAERGEENELLRGLAPGYCSHAFAVSSRMAPHLVRHLFPASDVIDSLFTSHFARQQGFRMRSFNHSLFAQLDKGSKGRLRKGLRSHAHGASVRLEG